MSFATIEVRLAPPVCHIRLNRPQARNTINRTMVEECRRALRPEALGPSVHIVVLEGLPDVFCLGADFDDYAGGQAQEGVAPDALYDLWSELASGPFVSIAHVRGKVNAGGVGFVGRLEDHLVYVVGGIRHHVGHEAIRQLFGHAAPSRKGDRPQ